MSIPPEPITRPPEADARLSRARRAAEAGDFPGAEQLLTDVLRDHEGTGSPEELRALSNLVTLLARTGRAQECLIVGRRLRDTALTVDATSTAIYAGIAITNAWITLDAPEEARRALAEADRDLERQGGATERVRAMRDAVGAVVALVSDDLDRGEAALAHLERTGRMDQLDGIRAGVQRMRAGVAQRRGDPARALELLDGALRTGGLRVTERIRLRCDRVGALIDLGRADESLAEACACLEDLRSVAPGAGRFQVEHATRLGDLLAADPRALDLALDAYDVAATGALRATADIDRTLRSLPGGLELPPAAERRLVAARERALARGHQVATRATHLLLARTNERSRGSEATGEGHVRVCAWCRRARSHTTDSVGEWVTLSVLLEEPLAGPVTHGVCDDCRP